MPTDPLPGVLDRAHSEQDVRQFTDAACPLLQEAINHATLAWRRCEAAPDDRGGPDEHLALLTMYRQMIEMADGIEVLLRHSCVLASVPLLRSLYEAKLGILFLTREPSVPRGLAWVITYTHQRLNLYRSLEAGGEIPEAWQRQFGAIPQVPGDLRRAIANLEEYFTLPHMVPIEVEYQAVRKARRGMQPLWYALFGGPRDLRALAKRLDREAEYLVYYRYWSRLAHGNDFSSYTTSLPGKGLTWLGIRFPGSLQQLFVYTLPSLLEGTSAMLKYFRPGESLRDWYFREIREPFRSLCDLDIDVRIL